MKCPKCHRTVPGDYPFCDYCGASLAKPALKSPVKPEGTKLPVRLNKRLIIICSLSIVLIISAGIWLSQINISTSGTEPSVSKPQPTPSITANTTPVSAEVIKLSYINALGSTNIQSKIIKMWADEIKSRTNGRVEIEINPGGTESPTVDAFPNVIAGKYDIGLIGLSGSDFSGGNFPVMELLALPNAFPNAWVATMSANDLYNYSNTDELDSVKVLYIIAPGPSMFLTSKKPINKLEDLKGIAIRSNAGSSKIIEALGAKYFIAPAPQMYELLARGTIEGVFGPSDFLESYKIADIVKYVTNCSSIGNATPLVVIINKNKWNALPEDIRAMFISASEEWTDKHARAFHYYNEKALDYFIGLPDRKLINLSLNEMSRFAAAMLPLKNTWINEKQLKGLPASEMDQYLADRISFWTAKTPTKSEIKEWAEKNLPPQDTSQTQPPPPAPSTNK